MTIYVNGQVTYGQCGIGRLTSFKDLENPDRGLCGDAEWWCNDFKLPIDVETYLRRGRGAMPIKELLSFDQHRGGTGLFGTGFINNNVCRKAWDELVKTFPLVFVTPIRMNKNSNNKFFYAMFDDKRNGDITYLEPMEWPFT